MPITQYQLLPNPKKTTKAKKIIIIAIIALAVFCVAFLGQIYIPSKSTSQNGIMVSIEKGDGLAEIANILKEKQIIDFAFLFEAGAMLKGVGSRLQAGVYYLSPSMSVSEILKILSRGEVHTDKITIIEGWGLKEIGWYLEGKGVFSAQEFFGLVGFPAEIKNEGDSEEIEGLAKKFDFLAEKPDGLGLEGYLFPDTYEIKRGETLTEVLEKILKNFDEKIDDSLMTEIQKQGKNLFQILTMASILEKEIKPIEDRPIAAGILWKRIKNGWPLQIDATVSYLISRPSLELTKNDLAIDSRYNTYKYYGLPAGPISNPGLDSIRAAVYYKESPYWFYLTPPDGTTVFSRNLEEHAANKVKYLKWNLYGE